MQSLDEVIEELYKGSRRYQEAKGILFALTLEQYRAKWSRYRLATLAKLIQRGSKALKGYLHHVDKRPVLGWSSKEARAEGVMHDGNSSIQMAKAQRWLFQHKAGDKHNESSLAKMRKPKTEQHRANMRKPKSPEHKAVMAESARKRWAKK